MVMPAGTEWMAAMITTGTPASRPPTSGSRSTRATKTPSSKAKGTPRISSVMPEMMPGDHRGGRVPEHVAGDRADGLVDDPVQAVGRRGLEEAEEPAPHAGGLQHGEEGQDADRHDGDDGRGRGRAHRQRGGRLQHLGDLRGELGRPLREVLLQVQAEDETADRPVSLLGLAARESGTCSPKWTAAVTSGSVNRYTRPPRTSTPTRKTSRVAPPWLSPRRRRKRVAGVRRSVKKKAMTT